MPDSPSLRIGVDIGGTFTDFALTDAGGRCIAVHKLPTTPRDPSRAVVEGLGAILAASGRAAADLAEVVHGTTLVTNALIERRGARTGMLVTRGFRDLFDIGREQRYDLFDLRLRFAEPLVPRDLRAEIPERLRHDGSILLPLDEDAVREALGRLVEEDRIESLAICFLHSYADGGHERRAREIAAELYPGLYVSGSADIFPYMREYERWTTACANAYAQPLVDRYLGRIERALGEISPGCRLLVVGSSGGLLTPGTARRYPVRLLESGPAAGALVAARFGRDLAIDNVLSFDLGGTTAKGALIRGGQALRKYTFEAAHVHEYRSGSGLQLQIPVVDMTEIGAGGGSLVSVDELGRLRVGPRSAGAEPGPVCYGSGGTGVTVTDANLCLGYLDPAYFLGGRMVLQDAAARRALGEDVAARLGLSLERAAWGIHDVANENIARAFRMHGTERGFDYRRCALVAFGGGGPIHAARIARKLRIPRVIFPAGAGVMSALGMLSGAPSFEIVQAFPRELDGLDGEEALRTVAGLDRDASAILLGAGVAPDAIRIERRADMRYRGQGYDIEVPLPPGPFGRATLERLPELFGAQYRTVFHTTLDEPVEIVSLKVEAIGPEPGAVADDVEPGPPGEGPDAAKGHRRAYFPEAGGTIDCAVLDRYRLRPGQRVQGPVLIEERESTCLLDRGDEAEVDRHGNLLASIGAG